MPRACDVLGQRLPPFQQLMQRGVGAALKGREPCEQLIALLSGLRSARVHLRQLVGQAGVVRFQGEKLARDRFKVGVSARLALCAIARIGFQVHCRFSPLREAHHCFSRKTHLVGKTSFSESLHLLPIEEHKGREGGRQEAALKLLLIEDRRVHISWRRHRAKVIPIPEGQGFIVGGEAELIVEVPPTLHRETPFWRLPFRTHAGHALAALSRRPVQGPLDEGAIGGVTGGGAGLAVQRIRRGRRAEQPVVQSF